ncbi:MAG TPA: hypothetical protein VGD80_16565 [Kofleriaceae bacterium]
MAVFILWLASFITSPGTGTPAQTSTPLVVPFLTTGDCSDAGCGLNGTPITGLAREIVGDARALTLPSGEHFTLR